MLKNIINFFMVAFLIAFIIFARKLNCLSVVLLYIFFALFIYLEIFSYKYKYKLIFNNAFFANSSLFKKIFSGKILISFTSVSIALIYAISIIFNAINIAKFDFIYIFLCLPALFILTKVFVIKYFKKDFKHIETVSKKWIIFISSFVSCALYAILFFNDFDTDIINANYFEYLKESAPVSNFKCFILNEFYAYSFYANSSALWIKNAFLQDYKIVGILLVFLNKFIFFIAINHIISFIFTKDKNGTKFGYFLKTIFILAYIVFIFLCAGYVGKENIQLEDKKETQVEQIFKIIINNGMKFDINASSLEALKKDINKTRLTNLSNSLNSINLYVDEIYDNGAKALSSKIADFRYSALSDYAILWHSALGKGANEYINEKFKEFADESFDKNFITNLENLINLAIDKFEKDLYKDIDKAIKNDDLTVEVDVNSTSFFSKQHHLNRAKFSGIGVGVGLVGKTLLKTAGKTATKTSAKIATSTVSGASGSVCGPGAVVCVPAFAIATWFGFDYAFAKGDEFLNRDAYEKEIYLDIMDNKNEFKKALNEEIEKTFNEIFDNFYILEKE